LLRRFFSLAPCYRRLVLEAACLQTGIAVGLRLIHFGPLRRVLDRFSAGETADPASASIVMEQIAWAVDASSRHLRAVSTCLTEALTAEAMLRRRGVPAHAAIGIDRPQGGVLHAHAWTELGGTIVTGGASRDKFALLAVLERRRHRER
jgi:hypothetical protein